MTDIDPELLADLLPPMGLYTQLDEISRMADDGDTAARRFILWFAAPNDSMQLEVDGPLDFDETARAAALFVAARAAAHEFEQKTFAPLNVTITVTPTQPNETQPTGE